MIDFDMERMKKALEGERYIMPDDLDREGLLAWMLEAAKKARAVMGISEEQSKAIAKRGRDLMVGEGGAVPDPTPSTVAAPIKRIALPPSE